MVENQIKNQPLLGGYLSRIALFYMVFWMLIGGIHTPFWQGWLENQGLEPKIIAILLGIAPISRPFIGVIIAWIVDKNGSRKWIISGLCFASAGIFYLFSQTSSLAIWFVITLLWGQLIWTASSLMTSMVAIATKREEYYGFSFKDVLLLTVMTIIVILSLCYYMHIKGEWSWINQLIFGMVILCMVASIVSYGVTKKLDFSQLRLWGTIGTITGITVMSFYLYATPIGYELMVNIICLGFLFLGIWSLILPDVKSAPTQHHLPPAIKLLKQPSVILLLVIAVFLQGSHGMLYAQGTIYWLQKGFNYVQIGQFWALGNIGELLLFTIGWFVKLRLRSSFILVIAGLFAALRWALIAFYGTEAYIVYLAMMLHGFTYAFAHLGAIYWMEKHIPENLMATMQTLYTSIVFGVALGMNMILAGYYVSWFSGEVAWLIMAAMGVIGGLLALWLKKFKNVYIQ